MCTSQDSNIVINFYNFEQKCILFFFFFFLPTRRNTLTLIRTWLIVQWIRTLRHQSLRHSVNAAKVIVVGLRRRRSLREVAHRRPGLHAFPPRIPAIRNSPAVAETGEQHRQEEEKQEHGLYSELPKSHAYDLQKGKMEDRRWKRERGGGREKFKG